MDLTTHRNFAKQLESGYESRGREGRETIWLPRKHKQVDLLAIPTHGTDAFALKSSWQQCPLPSPPSPPLPPPPFDPSRISVEDREGANGDDVGGSECGIEKEGG